VSDDLYGAGTRYVSRQRLEAMLDREWDQLQTQLRESRGSTSRFFAFADTVSARNFAGTNESHGWMGVRFLTEPGGEPNDVLLHVNLMDPSNPLQQEVLGVLGVNLVYSVYHQRESQDVFLRGLSDDMAAGRIEIDLIDIRGPAFQTWERRARLVDALQPLGDAVLLSRRRELYQTTAFVNRFTDAAVRFAVGLPTLIRVFQDAHYRHLEGRILEGIARLFAQNVRVCAYPMTVSALEERLRALSADGWELNDTGSWVTADRLRPAPPLS